MASCRPPKEFVRAELVFAHPPFEVRGKTTAEVR